MKKIVCILMAISIALLTWVNINNSNSIIIYSAQEDFRNDAMQKMLDNEFTDFDVKVIYMPTAKIATKIRVEGSKTDADIIVGVENAYMDRLVDSLADVSSYSSLKYMEDSISKSNKYLTWERAAGSIIINNKIIEKHNLPIPQTYDDLLNPIYKNFIAMPDPKTSGTGFYFLKNIINVRGEEEGFKFFDKFSKNVKQFTESGSGPVKLLIQGEIAIGLGMTFQGVTELNNGNDFTLLEPEYGCPFNLTSTSMIEGRQNNSNIEKVFKFVVNECLVQDKETGNPEKILVDQKIIMKNYPQNINYADMTGIEDIKEKERLLEKWKY